MPVIEIEDDALIVNGMRLTLPIERKELNRLLGQPNRESERANDVLTWDELGILAYQTPDTEEVRAIEIAFEREALEFSPKQTFSGVLKVEGTVVTSQSTVKSINQSIKPKTIAPQEDEDDDSWELRYEKCILYVTTKGPESFVSLVQFDLKEDDEQ